MSDGSLSQEEIDALLQGGGGMDAVSMEGPSSDYGGESSALSTRQQSIFESLLTEIKNAQGSNLSGMIGKSVKFQNPTIEVIANGRFLATLPERVVEVRIDFSEGLKGHHSYIFSPEMATAIAGLMMGQRDVDLNDAALSALEEAGNSIAGTSVTSIGDRIGKTVMTTPGATRSVARDDVQLPDGEFVKVLYTVNIEGERPAKMIEIFALPMVTRLTQMLGAEPEDAESAGPDFGFGDDTDFSTPVRGRSAGGRQQGFMMGQSQPNVQSVQFTNLTPSGSGQDQGNIGLLMDVYMEMTVELGRTKKLIREILGMGEGTIIELDKLAGEPVDILVNHKPIAKGEVVVIDENFGVRVTEIINQSDRLSEIS